MNSNCRRLLLSCAALAGPPLARAQVWTTLSNSLPMSHGVPAAYDSHRDRVVVLAGGGPTWEHDGASWRVNREPLPFAFGYSTLALCYQPHRSRMLSFGLAHRALGLSLPATIEYDGVSWVQRSPAHTPPARTRTHMAYDRVRQRAVLFGGSGYQSNLWNDTWEWDGVDWLRRLPPNQPPAREFAAMGFDPQRGVVLVFGGQDAAGVHFGDCWQWNGTDWSPRNDPGLPSARTHAQLVDDPARARAVIYGGEVQVGASLQLDPDPYEFDGAQWQRRQLPTAPEARSGHTMVSVPLGLRVFGGGGANGGLYHDVYDYDGVRFQVLGPRPMVGTAVATDGNGAETVAVGLVDGAMRTLVCDGISLVDQNVPGPTARLAHAVASGRASVVLFGGASPNSSTNPQFLGDTWVFQAGAWQNVTTFGPSARSRHAMAYDPVRNRVALFGGQQGTGTLDDLWEFDGATWVRQFPVGPAPGPRRLHAMAYDVLASRIVMHGHDELLASSDTWEWDGQAWSQTYAGPVPGLDVAMAWSTVGQHLVLAAPDYSMVGGQSYAFDRTAGWTPLRAMQQQPNCGCLAPEPGTDLLHVGGYDGRSVELLTGFPGAVQPGSGGCSNANVPPSLVCHDRARIGNVMQFELLRAEPQQVSLLAWTPDLTQTAVWCGPIPQPVLLAFGLTSPFGRLAQAVALPPLPALVGFTLRLQAATLEVQGPLLGALALSDELFVTLGR